METKTKKEMRVVHYIYCPICNKEIKGSVPSQVEYNLKLHLDKHKKGETK